MSGALLVIAERKGAALARISAEVATIALRLASAAELECVGVVAGSRPLPAATELAQYLPRVVALDVPAEEDHIAPAAIAPSLLALFDREEPSYIFVGATPEGRDIAGTLSALLGWGLLVNADAVEWDEGRPLVSSSVFGGTVATVSDFVDHHGIVTVRQASTSPSPIAAPGTVEAATVSAVSLLPIVPIRASTPQSTATIPIEEAEVVVAGGRGIGGPEGVALLEALAEALGGVVGASRAPVDAGWIPFSQQIGQSGKVVKPRLYLALGISGAIQHKVGMQASETIVAVDRDPEAPIAGFADLFVRGDLFEVGRALLAELESRGT